MKTSSDLRILHLIPRIAVTSSGVAIGGSTSSLLSLIDTQRRLKGYKIGVVSGAKPTDSALSGVVGSDVDLFTMRMRGRPVTYRYGLEFAARSFLKSSKLARDFNPTILHGHSGRWHYSVATYVAARRLAKPWIQTLYCPVPRPGGAAGRILRYALLNAEAVVGISANIVRSVARAGVPAGRLHHIDPCIDTARFRPTGAIRRTRESLEMPLNGKLILFVGNP